MGYYTIGLEYYVEFKKWNNIQIVVLKNGVDTSPGFLRHRI